MNCIPSRLALVLTVLGIVISNFEIDITEKVADDLDRIDSEEDRYQYCKEVHSRFILIFIEPLYASPLVTFTASQVRDGTHMMVPGYKIRELRIISRSGIRLSRQCRTFKILDRQQSVQCSSAVIVESGVIGNPFW